LYRLNVTLLGVIRDHLASVAGLGKWSITS